MKIFSDISQNQLHNGLLEIDSYCVVLYNGCLSGNEQPRQLPEGVIASIRPDGNGFYVFVPAGIKLSRPIQIINLFDGNNDAPVQSRNLAVMESGSCVELLICDYNISGEAVNVEDATEVTLGDAASLEMVRLQKMNTVSRLTTATIVQQAASSRMRTHYITLGGGSINNSLKVRLTGKRAEHTAFGLSLAQQTEKVNNDVLIVHASPDCQSKQLFKNILSDKSTGAYTGRIVVDKYAQKTTAYQRNNNILLHPKAKMSICPQLEIYADDVKCSHGATVGQLDAEALFYLRSRGINENEAKKLLLHAFASEVLDTVSCTSFREHMQQLTEQYLMVG